MSMIDVEYKATAHERWRLYFNSRNAAPVVCSLDNGAEATEFSVQQAILHNIPLVQTKFIGGKKQPVFFVEFCGRLEMSYGIAHFYPIDLPMTATELQA